MRAGQSGHDVAGYSRVTPLRYEQEILDDVNDGLVVGDISDYRPADITAQLVDSEAGRRIDLMLGGGRASWLPRNQTEADTRRVGEYLL